jgi:5-methylcytosine-specific restriction endonuclease McrA
MNSYLLSHVSNDALLRDLATSVKQDRATTATMLAQIAEVDHRQLYRAAAFESMYLYCLHELRMSEDVAYMRIRAARAARKFPALFAAVADGRLHLTAVLLLAPHLTTQTADALIAEASHKTKAKIELLLARHFPKPDLPAVMRPVATAVVATLASAEHAAPPTMQLGLDPVVPSHAPDQAVPMEPLATATAAPARGKLSPLSPGRFALQATIDQETHDALCQAQELLGHSLPSGDLATVLKNAALAYVQLLERQKFAKCRRPRPQRVTAKGRHIPAEVKRTVWERDGGQCTFVSEHGKRCEARRGLEFDHIEAVARGGQSTASNIRLRCRAHNQYTAECTYGAGFMAGKREQARSRAMRAKLNDSARELPTDSAAPSPASRAWPGGS